MADWKSLTDGEWVNIVNSDAVKDEGSYVHGAVCAAFKLIEAKLREKNEPKTALDYFIEDVEAAEGGWQPMETAPKDGTVVLIFVPRSQGVFCAYWYEANNDSFGDEDFPWVILDPQGDRELNAWAAEHVTRWAPLPAPPAMKGEQP